MKITAEELLSLSEKRTNSDLLKMFNEQQRTLDAINQELSLIKQQLIYLASAEVRYREIIDVKPKE